MGSFVACLLSNGQNTNNGTHIVHTWSKLNKWAYVQIIIIFLIIFLPQFPFHSMWCPMFLVCWLLTPDGLPWIWRKFILKNVPYIFFTIEFNTLRKSFPKSGIICIAKAFSYENRILRDDIFHHSPLCVVAYMPENIRIP